MFQLGTLTYKLTQGQYICYHNHRHGSYNIPSLHNHYCNQSTISTPLQEVSSLPAGHLPTDQSLAEDPKIHSPLSSAVHITILHV